jgi:thiol-disulfide isomerase/thioredoxin
MRTICLAAGVVAALIVAPLQAAELRPFVSGSWQTILTGHKAKPVIVHLWGLTCAPCIAELPRWAALQRERPDMAVVMIASDPFPNDPEGQATVLKKAGLSATENWTFADAFTERLRHEVDPKWRGEIPRTILIKADGSRDAIVGPVDTRAIRNWFDSQVGNKP